MRPRYDSIVVHGLNPEPWRVGPIQKTRYGKKTGNFVGADPAVAAFQEGYRDELRLNGCPLLEPPYQIRFWWWRELPTYVTASGRKQTKKPVDQTNLQKAAEDALQPQKQDDHHEFFAGIIVNDKHNQSSGGMIVAQEKGVYPIIALEIVSHITTTDRLWLPQEMLPETAEMVYHIISTYPKEENSADEDLLGGLL